MSIAEMGTSGRGTAVRGSGEASGNSLDIKDGQNSNLPNTGRMTHSLSTPSGVDGTQSTPRHRGGKKLTARVQMLDDSITMFQVQVSLNLLSKLINKY